MADDIVMLFASCSESLFVKSNRLIFGETWNGQLDKIKLVILFAHQFHEEDGKESISYSIFSLFLSILVQPWFCKSTSSLNSIVFLDQDQEFTKVEYWSQEMVFYYFSFPFYSMNSKFKEMLTRCLKLTSVLQVDAGFGFETQIEPWVLYLFWSISGNHLSW